MSLSVEVTHRFPGFTLEAAFTAPGGVTALFGRSGAGKTTLINAIAGLLNPDHGRIEAGGTVLTDTLRGIALPPSARRIGYVFQDARLFPHMTVRRNLEYGRRVAPRRDRPDDRRVQDIVALLGIEALLDRRPGALSGGEKQRVALGRAILSAPRLLLMDEPLAALDAARKAEILPYLARLRDLGLPILYVSHNLSEITQLADRMVLLDAGRVTASGRVGDVLSDPERQATLGRDAGAVLHARVVAQEADGLARLETGAGPVWVTRPDLPVPAQVRLRILSHEVMLATERPASISALNMLSGVVGRIVPDSTTPEGSGSVLVRIELGNNEALLSRITARSCAALQLAPGKPVHAILKSVSIDEVTRERSGTSQVLNRKCSTSPSLTS
ncbi:molybdenum ABC transporter ATP-binding protein [Paracoccus aerodenitrificans]|uniref:molybdenum ABC transporter ATP-binding protein n=1 Tax=Paracoccus aerodenitrificans TaxID=3017781 RepID=UPI0022F074AF|nr:molybdenum ABC transporter ATP-binding protein [Paracoccus aerodenitrificans]WBU65408.1 molybdenum ABC transporter ATP-binding protein [Paracoccus aerodenitrificans]